MAKKEANEILEQARADIASGKKFSYDTNFLVNIAKQGKEGNKLLKTLSTIKNFHISNSVIRELDGQIINKRYDKKILTYLDNFLRAYKRRKVREEKRAEKGADAEKIQAFLQPMIDLLPRKLVTDVFVDFYAEVKDHIEEDFFFYDRLDKINTRIAEKFEERLKKYGIADVITDSEKFEYLRFTGLVKKEIGYFIEQHRHVPREIEKFLGIQKSKSYFRDVKIVAAAISRAEKLRSRDSDVIWLENFYNILSRKAA